MTKKDVLEIKRRFKKEACTFTRLCGCYVNSEKEKLLTFGETFLNLEEEEFFKYLDIANKSLSGRPGNNLLSLEFAQVSNEDETAAATAQASLLTLRDSKLDQEEILSSFYDSVIEHYEADGNYLILVYHDVYDIPLKTTDEMLLDESEDVYEYILCAICPVSLSKSAIGYLEGENRMGALPRDWTVGMPESAFVFPDFQERSVDIHSVCVYTKNAKNPHREFWENFLECPGKFTSTEKKLAFEGMIKKVVGSEGDEAKEAMLDVEENLDAFIKMREEKAAEDAEEIHLSGEDFKEILIDSGVSENAAERVKDTFDEFFSDEAPLAGELLDTRSLKDTELRSEAKELRRQLVKLNDELIQTGARSADGRDVEIVVRVPEGRAGEVSAAFVDGVRSIVIPLAPEDSTTINGEIVSL